MAQRPQPTTLQTDTKLKDFITMANECFEDAFQSLYLDSLSSSLAPSQAQPKSVAQAQPPLRSPVLPPLISTKWRLAGLQWKQLRLQ